MFIKSSRHHLVYRRLGAHIVVLALMLCASCDRSQGQTGQTPKAIAALDIQTIKTMLQNDPKIISLTDEHGNNLLDCAAANGRIDLAQLMLDHHVDVNYRSLGQLTPLFGAVMSGRKEMVKFLVDHGADVNAKANDALTPLHVIVMKGVMGDIPDDMVKLLLDYKADLNAKDTLGNTPIDYAAGENRKNIVELLLTHGAQINGALFNATSAGLPDMVELLLSKGADINAKNSDGESALDVAVFGTSNLIIGPHTDVAKLLLSHKAQYTVFDAAALGDIETVKKMVAEKPSLVSTKNTRGKTLLHYAAQLEQKDMAEFLIANKAEIDAKDKEGETPLHYAAEAGRLDIAELLLANKADVNAKDNGGLTPLHLAAEMGHDHADVVQLLLDHGADVNAKTYIGGRTPLYEAARDSDSAKILIQHGGHR